MAQQTSSGIALNKLLHTLLRYLLNSLISLSKLSRDCNFQTYYFPFLIRHYNAALGKNKSKSENVCLRGAFPRSLEIFDKFNFMIFAAPLCCHARDSCTVLGADYRSFLWKILSRCQCPTLLSGLPWRIKYCSAENVLKTLKNFTPWGLNQNQNLEISVDERFPMKVANRRYYLDKP